jgi:uncharacterized protein (DUF2252 family)
MGAPMRARHLAAILPVLLLAAAATAAPESLAVDPRDPRFVGRSDLVGRISATPHGYFRFINSAFAAEACRLFADAVDRMPEVNLHGDAHIEQYTVTNLGRGLSDFDDCTRGKAVIDLVRLGSSLLIAAREKGWTRDETSFVDQALRGYRAGLKDERLHMATPDLATRARQSFRWDHARALRQASALIDQAPLANDAFADGVTRFVELVGFGRELAPDHFKVKRIGALTIGVGSALDEKYLILFEGPSPAPEDDMIVEAKQIRELAGNPCVRTDVGASRVLDGQRLIAYEPFAYAAVVPHDGKYFWMHDWTDDYQEASIATQIRSPRDLRQIAYDVGVQMGRAHPKLQDGSQSKARRQEVLRSFESIEGRLRIAMRELAGRTDAAWRQFRQGVAAPAPGGQSLN